MKAPHDERGSVLLLSLVVITLLAAIGLMASQTSTVETRIAGNDRAHKTVFYRAEGGAETGIELLEENIDERGFGVDAFGTCLIGNVAVDTVDSLRFYMNDPLPPLDKPGAAAASHDATIPRAQNPATPPVTNLSFGGVPRLSEGGAIEMTAGYEGKGKSTAGAGAWIIYDVRSRHEDIDNTESTINVCWLHVM